MSGKTGPLMTLAELNYDTAVEIHNDKGRTCRRKALPSLIRRIALEEVAHRLGDPRSDPASWRALLEEVAADEYNAELRNAQPLAYQILSDMAHIQQTVTGSLQARSALDA